ncbi:MAG: hypothetical protein SGBAC_009954 [Bacillariaceae sp.]
MIDLGGSLSSLRSSITNKFGFKKKRESRTNSGIEDSFSEQGKEKVAIEHLPTDDSCQPPPLNDDNDMRSGLQSLTIENSPAVIVKSIDSNTLRHIDNEELKSIMPNADGGGYTRVDAGEKTEFPDKPQLTSTSASNAERASASTTYSESPHTRQLIKASSYSRPKSPLTGKPKVRLSGTRKLALADGSGSDDDEIEPELVEKRRSLGSLEPTALDPTAKNHGSDGNGYSNHTANISSFDHDSSSSSSDDSMSIKLPEDDYQLASIPGSMRSPILSSVGDTEVNLKSKAKQRLRTSIGSLPAPPNEDSGKEDISQSESFDSPKNTPKRKDKLRRSSSYSGKESPRIGIRKGGRRSGTFDKETMKSTNKRGDCSESTPNPKKPLLRRSLTSPEGSNRGNPSIDFSTSSNDKLNPTPKSSRQRKSPATSKSPRTSKSPLGREIKAGQTLHGSTVKNVSLDFLVSPRAVQVRRRISLSNGAVISDTYTKERTLQKDDLEGSPAVIRSHSRNESDDEEIAKLKSFLYQESDGESENSAELESAAPDIDELRAEAKAIMEKRRQEKGIPYSRRAAKGTASNFRRLSEPLDKNKMAKIGTNDLSFSPKRSEVPPKKVRSFDSVDSIVGLDEGENSFSKTRGPVRGIGKSLSSSAPKSNGSSAIETKKTRELTRGIGKSRSYGVPRSFKRSQSPHRDDSRAARRLQVFGAIGLDFDLDGDNFPVLQEKKPITPKPSKLKSEVMPDSELGPTESNLEPARAKLMQQNETMCKPEEKKLEPPAVKHWFESPSAILRPKKKMKTPLRGVGRSKSADPSLCANPSISPDGNVESAECNEEKDESSATQPNANPEVEGRSDLSKSEARSKPKEEEKPVPSPVKHWFDSPSAILSPKKKVKMAFRGVGRSKSADPSLFPLHSILLDGDEGSEQKEKSTTEPNPEPGIDERSEFPNAEADLKPEEEMTPEPPPIKHWFDSPSAVSPKQKVKIPFQAFETACQAEEDAQEPVSADTSEDFSVASENLLDDEESSVEITVSDSDQEGEESTEEEVWEDSDDDITLETVESEVEVEFDEVVEDEIIDDFSYDEESVHENGDTLMDEVSGEFEYEEIIEEDSLDEDSSYSEESIEEYLKEDSLYDSVEEEIIDDVSTSDSDDDVSYEEEVLSIEDATDGDKSFEELSVVDEEVDDGTESELEEVYDDEVSFEEMVVSDSDADDDEMLEHIMEESSLDDSFEEISVEDIQEESSLHDIIEEEILEDIAEESSLEDHFEEISLEDIFEEYEEFNQELVGNIVTGFVDEPFGSIAEALCMHETVIEEEIEDEEESYYSAVEDENDDGAIVEDGADFVTEIFEEVYEGDFDDMPTEMVPISDSEESAEEDIAFADTEHDTPFDSYLDYALPTIGEDEEVVLEDDEMIVADDDELYFEEESFTDIEDFVGDMHRSFELSSQDSDFRSRSFDSSTNSEFSVEGPDLPDPQLPPAEQLRIWQEDQDKLIRQMDEGPKMYPRTPKHILNAILSEAELDYQYSKGVQAPDYHMIEFLAVVEEAVAIGKFTKKTEEVVEKVSTEPLSTPPQPPPPEEPEDGWDKPRTWKFEVPTLPVLNTWQEEEKKKEATEMEKEVEEHGYVREDFVVGPEIAAPTPKNVMMAILSAAALDFKLRKVPEQHKQEFESISEAASSIARLTKLKEKVVETVSVGEAVLKKQDDWTPAGKPIEFTRSADVILANEAAMMGKLMKRREKEVVSNFDFKARFKMFEDKFDVDEAFDEKGRKIFRTDLLLDQYIKERKEQKAEANYGMHLVEQVQEQDKLKTNISLPTKKLPNVARKAGKQMTQAEWTEILSKAVAERSWDRRYRLHRPKVTLKIKKQCMCPYCSNPNPYQTHEYKRLQEINDKRQK